MGLMPQVGPAFFGAEIPQRGQAAIELFEEGCHQHFQHVFAGVGLQLRQHRRIEQGRHPRFLARRLLRRRGAGRDGALGLGADFEVVALVIGGAAGLHGCRISRGIACGSLGLIQSQPASDTVDQPGEVERLGKVVIHPGREAAFAVAGHGVGGQGHDRHLAVQAGELADLPGRRQPVHDRHGHVHEHEVVDGGRGPIYPFLPVFGHVQRHRQVFEEGLDHRAVGGAVFDQQDAVSRLL